MIQSGNPLVVRGRRSLLSAPAQIRASPIRALGSYPGCLTANRTLGQGCKTLGLGGTPSPSCRVAEPRKIRRLAIVPASCDAYLDRYSSDRNQLFPPTPPPSDVQHLHFGTSLPSGGVHPITAILHTMRIPQRSCAERPWRVALYTPANWPGFSLPRWRLCR